jgi:tripartite-type tricarboxylate transporter receptor subunit TctC
MKRREFIAALGGAVAWPVVGRAQQQQAYPTRPVRFIIGYPPGGSADITARLMGHWLSDRLGQPFIIESRPGASTNAINASLYHKLPFDFIRDIAPVAGIIRFPNVVMVNPSVPAQSIPELIAYAKANPGKLNMASAGNGSTTHVSGELFKMMTGINMVHVPYRGAAPALTDLISGHVQVIFENPLSSIEFIRSGKLRPWR